MIEDKFTFYKENVKKALEKYRAFANKYYQGTYKGQGKSELIERQAKPFVDGYFTLAIMGNTSAGKSTFINALVGKVDLLPTDFRQTTCVLTEIVYGEKLDIKITYGDGHIQHFTDSSKLKELVAIPEEYSDYPINTLNDWIMRGFTKEAQFIRRKDELEHIQKMPLDENVIRKYVQTHNPSNIAVKVEIKYPLPQCYQGWRIVDTPGVNALGGIEDRAKDFVNQKDFRGNSSVDAIIFIKKGPDSISDKGFKEFIDSVWNSLSQDAKKRLFLLFSFASDPQFIINEDKITESAKKLVASNEISDDRIIPIDNLCELLLKKIERQNLDVMNINLKTEHCGWDEKAWRLAINCLFNIKNSIQMNGDPLNNQEIKISLQDYSGFDKLQKKLNDFVQEEKQKAYLNLINDIENDMQNMAESKKNIINGLNDELNSSGREVENAKSRSERKLDEANAELSKLVNAITHKYTKPYIVNYFKDIDNEIMGIYRLSDINSVKNKVKPLAQDIQNKCVDLFNSISAELNEINFNKNIQFPSIDFDKLLDGARDKAEEFIGYEKKKTTEKKGSSTYEKIVDDPSKPKYQVNSAKMLREFQDSVYNDFTEKMKTNMDTVVDTIYDAGDQAQKVLKETINLEKSRLEGIMKQYSDVNSKKMQVQALGSEVMEIEKSINFIKSLK